MHHVSYIVKEMHTSCIIDAYPIHLPKQHANVCEVYRWMRVHNTHKKVVTSKKEEVHRKKVGPSKLNAQCTTDRTGAPAMRTSAWGMQHFPEWAKFWPLSH